MYLPATAPTDRRVKVLAPNGMVVGLKIDEGEMFGRLLREETMPIRPGESADAQFSIRV